MRILLAEDEEMTAAVLSGSLTSMGHQVTVATDGLSAWQMLQNEHFPLVISDWMMPGLDGPTLCRRIRAVGDSPYTYIILLSVRDRHVDRREGLRAGADDFLVAFGHPAGDDVLRGVAEVLRTGCRAHDTAARYGGEEFVVLLPATGPVVARGMAERLRLAVERRDWPDCLVTASFGVATMTARTCRPGDLVEQADLALYHSKHHGRNQFTHMTDLGGRPKVGAWKIPEPKCSPPIQADPAVEDPWNDLGLSPPPGPGRQQTR
jgi:PleD family two-component response regulator